ncbi:WhiB family transcriptional regulator [Cellulomonas sp. NPDC058312]|uniref:WhiB family transcriptional regulator n=1 Tax=Cellulomonas sp. NPDC058312 TaxID=3346441 RepID=UPI0036E19DE2
MNDQFDFGDEPDPVRWFEDPERHCVGTGEAMWFVPDGHRHVPELNRAKALCADCPVLLDCAADAYELGDRHGVRATVNLSSSTARRKLAEILGIA